MKLREIAVTTALAACLSLTASPHALAHVGTTDIGQYVALGSSYAAGPGVAPQIDAGCARSENNYAHLFAQGRGTDLIDVTCGGATTANILGEGQRLRGGETLAPQIDAVTADTSLVSITIGGNDLGLIGGMMARSCGPIIASQNSPLAAALSQTCATVSGVGNLPTVGDFALLEHSLKEIVRAIRAKSPAALVAFVQYLPVLDSRATTCTGTIELSPSDAVASQYIYSQLVATTRTAAQSTGAITVEIPDADAHNACSADPWVNGFRNPLTLGDIDALGSSYHPNLAGMHAVADQLLKVLPVQ